MQVLFAPLVVCFDNTQHRISRKRAARPPRRDIGCLCSGILLQSAYKTRKHSKSERCYTSAQCRERTRGCKFWWRIRPRISRLDGKRSIHDSQCLTGIPLFGGLTAWFLHFPENLSWTCCIWNDLLKTTHTAWILVWGLPERFCIYVSTWMCGHAWMSA